MGTLNSIDRFLYILHYVVMKLCIVNKLLKAFTS